MKILNHLSYENKIIEKQMKTKIFFTKLESSISKIKEDIKEQIIKINESTNSLFQNDLELNGLSKFSKSNINLYDQYVKDLFTAKKQFYKNVQKTQMKRLSKFLEILEILFNNFFNSSKLLLDYINCFSENNYNINFVEYFNCNEVKEQVKKINLIKNLETEPQHVKLIYDKKEDLFFDMVKIDLNEDDNISSKNNISALERLLHEETSVKLTKYEFMGKDYLTNKNFMSFLLHNSFPNLKRLDFYNLDSIGSNDRMDSLKNICHGYIPDNTGIYNNDSITNYTSNKQIALNTYKIINLYYCKLQQSILIDSIVIIPKLTSLSLVYCNINTNVFHLILNNLNNEIEYLDLSHNLISDLDGNQCKLLNITLKTLCLSYNKITNPGNLSKVFTNLFVLDVSNNMINSFDAKYPINKYTISQYVDDVNKLINDNNAANSQTDSMRIDNSSTSNYDSSVKAVKVLESANEYRLFLYIASSNEFLFNFKLKQSYYNNIKYNLSKGYDSVLKSEGYLRTLNISHLFFESDAEEVDISTTNTNIADNNLNNKINVNASHTTSSPPHSNHNKTPHELFFSSNHINNLKLNLKDYTLKESHHPTLKITDIEISPSIQFYLEELILSNNNLSSKLLHKFFSKNEAFHKLRRLDLSFNLLQEDADINKDFLVNFDFSVMKRLKAIDLSNNCYTKHCLNTISLLNRNLKISLIQNDSNIFTEINIESSQLNKLNNDDLDLIIEKKGFDIENSKVIIDMRFNALAYQINLMNYNEVELIKNLQENDNSDLVKLVILD